MSDIPKYSELKLLELLYPQNEQLKLYPVRTKSRCFRPSRVTEVIIDKYLEETLPRKLQYRPIRKDLDRRQAVRSFWSMINSELQWTWPKEEGAKVIATGSLLNQSPFLRKIVEDHGGELMPELFNWQAVYATHIQPEFTLEHENFEAMVMNLKRKEAPNVISYSFFDNMFDLN